MEHAGEDPTSVGPVVSPTSFTVLMVAPAPTVSRFTPASVPLGTTVTITGSRFTGATAVAFNGAAATSFAAASATQITALVPPAATTGPITVTTPAGSATSPTDFIVTAAPAIPTVILKISGLTAGAVRLGKIITASGAVTPLSLIRTRVVLSVQNKRGATWIKVKTTSVSSRPVGKYRWKYAPAVKGAHRIRAQVAASATCSTATTPWRSFTVKEGSREAPRTSRGLPPACCRRAPRLAESPCALSRRRRRCPTPMGRMPGQVGGHTDRSARSRRRIS